MTKRITLTLIFSLLLLRALAQKEHAYSETVRIINNSGDVSVCVKNLELARVFIRVVNPMGEVIYRKFTGTLIEDIVINMSFFQGFSGYYFIDVRVKNKLQRFWFLKGKIVTKGELVEGFGFLYRDDKEIN